MLKSFGEARRRSFRGKNPHDPATVMRFSDGAELASIPNYVYAPFFAVLIELLSLSEP